MNPGTRVRVVRRIDGGKCPFCEGQFDVNLVHVGDKPTAIEMITHTMPPCDEFLNETEQAYRNAVRRMRGN